MNMCKFYIINYTMYCMSIHHQFTMKFEITATVRLDGNKFCSDLTAS